MVLSGGVKSQYPGFYVTEYIYIYPSPAVQAFNRPGILLRHTSLALHMVTFKRCYQAFKLCLSTIELSPCNLSKFFGFCSSHVISCLSRKENQLALLLKKASLCNL